MTYMPVSPAPHMQPQPQPQSRLSPSPGSAAARSDPPRRRADPVGWRFAAAVVTAALRPGRRRRRRRRGRLDRVAGRARRHVSHRPPTARTVVDRGDAPAADGSVESVAATVLPSVVKIDVAGPRAPVPARASSSARTARSSPTTTWSSSPATAARCAVSFERRHARADADVARHRPAHRHRRDPGRRTSRGLTPGHHRRVRQPRRRPGRRRRRLAVRPRRHRHQRHRQRARPPGQRRLGRRRATPRRTPPSRPTRRSTPATAAARSST